MAESEDHEGEEQPMAPLTYAHTHVSLLRDLRNIGVANGNTVLVHTSFSKVGFCSGGPAALIHALQHAADTIVMPTMTPDLSDPAYWCMPPLAPELQCEVKRTMLPFDPLRTPSRRMGVVAELFRTWPGSVRSLHPQCSFAASGSRAESVCSVHDLECALGRRSPLGALYEMQEAHVLLLGVGFGNCSCLHLSEYCVDDALVERREQGYPVRMNADGNVEWEYVNDVVPCEDDFPQIGSAFIRSAKASGSTTVREGVVGNAHAVFFPLRDCVDFGVQWMQEHRERTNVGP